VNNSSEDCLYLNVYTPSIDGNFPVMFWIHGGAFYLGHSDSNMFGPDYFMDTNVVLVSINFRLGILGEYDIYTINTHTHIYEYIYICISRFLRSCKM